MLRRAGRILIATCLVGGFCLTSYGVVRESFADLAVPSGPGYGQGGFGAGGFGGGRLDVWEERAVHLGTALGLLPATRALDVYDRRRNAASAVVGLLLLAVVTVADAFEKLRR